MIAETMQGRPSSPPDRGPDLAVGPDAGADVDHRRAEALAPLFGPHRAGPKDP